MSEQKNTPITFETWWSSKIGKRIPQDENGQPDFKGAYKDAWDAGRAEAIQELRDMKEVK